jgi:hypothetical protein
VLESRGWGIGACGNRSRDAVKGRGRTSEGKYQDEGDGGYKQYGEEHVLEMPRKP